MPIIVLLLIIILPVFATDYYEEGKNFAKNINELSNASEQKVYIKKKIDEIQLSSNKLLTDTTDKKCSAINEITDVNPSFYVFISLSMPKESLIELSKELEKTNGVFVLRGLPENSFKELSAKIYELRKQGLRATIQIDPRLFLKYDIQQVPCFVVNNDNGFDKLYGNVSLAFALEKLNKEPNETF